MFKKVLDYAGEYRRLTYRSVAVLLLGVTMSVDQRTHSQHRRWRSVRVEGLTSTVFWFFPEPSPISILCYWKLGRTLEKTFC